LTHFFFGGFVVGEGVVVEKKVLSFDDWIKAELRVGLIESVDDILGKDKLYKFSVDFGSEGKRTILAGLKPYYSKEELLGKKTVFVFNLAPRSLAGFESQGMILAAKTPEGKYKITSIDDSIVQGTRLE
jgi:methionyl-tRNA synthetase